MRALWGQRAIWDALARPISPLQSPAVALPTPPPTPASAIPPQVLEQEGRYSRAWLLAADVDKSPMPMHRGKR
jgi:hypothetical protein